MEVVNGTKCISCTNNLCTGFEPHSWRYVKYLFNYRLHIKSIEKIEMKNRKNIMIQSIKSIQVHDIAKMNV